MLRPAKILIQLFADMLCLYGLAFRSSRSIKAENLFLRRQLALYIERGIKPRRVDPVTRIALALLSRFFNWRDALVVVRPETLIRWHRAGWKLFWRLKSRPGRPPIPQQIQTLIRRMAHENPSWGEERIANEPPHSPKTNAICERVIGTIRRECLDWLIPVSEGHLRFTLKCRIRHYNGGRPHMGLGPGVPDPPVGTLVLPVPNSRHRRGESYAVRAKPILGGLHHEYSLAMAYT
ncbi:MAG TPA: integrase core domain-containing protein [Isosphaeraceae bacterium]|nr:integrase core domain-containing protein [Isosphaeraceae bacterium]